MSNEELIPTRASLLNRLKDWGDNDSWQEFNDTYRHLLYRKARNAGLTDAEAQDVVQDTLLSVARQMPGFRYDPAVASFKTWLHQVVTRRIADHFRRRGRQVRVAERPLIDTGTASLERFADPADPALDALWDKEWEETLCAAAQRRVRRKASPEQFQIYEYHVLAFLTDPDVVARILKHLELPSVAPTLLPALRHSEEYDLFADAPVDSLSDGSSFIEDRPSRPRPARAPP